MRYRRELDGLRALAVVPVIFFHAGFAAFSGGFVGVDVFFVISGFLITSIILADLEASQFSLLRFYERRARRILPALFLVMAATSLFAYSWMMPDEFKNFGQSMLATATFSNNILEAFKADYWSLDSAFKPLLHTWSLGVEEQYYVIFPLLMILCWAYFRSWGVFVLVFLFVVSMSVAVWGVAHVPTIAFYSLPTRAWEILLGALAAYYLAHNTVDVLALSRNQALSLIGVVLILSVSFHLQSKLSVSGPHDPGADGRSGIDHCLRSARDDRPSLAQHSDDGGYGANQLQPVFVAPAAVRAGSRLFGAGSRLRRFRHSDRTDLRIGLSDMAFRRNAMSK